MKLAWMLLLAVIFCGLLLGCSEVESTGCPEGTELAVYERLERNLRGYNSVNAWIDHPTKDALDKEQAEIDRIRIWMKTAQLDRCARAQYDQWLTYYYQNGLNEAREEITRHPTAKEMAAYDADWKREKESAQKLVIPAPPSPQEKN